MKNPKEPHLILILSKKRVKSNISSHSKPRTKSCTRLVKCFVLQHSLYRLKVFQSRIQSLRAYTWILPTPRGEPLFILQSFRLEMILTSWTSLNFIIRKKFQAVLSMLFGFGNNKTRDENIKRCSILLWCSVEGYFSMLAKQKLYHLQKLQILRSPNLGKKLP